MRVYIRISTNGSGRKMIDHGNNTIDRQLFDAFKELAVKQPIEKITIRQITDQAGVIRATFYNHFADKYRLIESIITTELLEPLRPLLKNGMLLEAMVVLLNNIETDRAFYSRLVRLQEPISFRDLFIQCAAKELEMVVNDMESGKKYVYGWIKPEVIAAYYAQSICFVITEWIQKGRHLPARLAAEEYFILLSHPVNDMIGCLKQAQ